MTIPVKPPSGKPKPLFPCPADGAFFVSTEAIDDERTNAIDIAVLSALSANYWDHEAAVAWIRANWKGRMSEKRARATLARLVEFGYAPAPPAVPE